MIFTNFHHWVQQRASGVPKMALVAMMGGSSVFLVYTSYYSNNNHSRTLLFPSTKTQLEPRKTLNDHHPPPVFPVFPETQQQSSLGVSPTNASSKQRRRRVLIIGGGAVGIATAYMIASSSSETSIVVLEANSESAMECTACAAGGMQISNPVVDRNSWIAVAKCLFIPNNYNTLLAKIREWWNHIKNNASTNSLEPNNPSKSTSLPPPSFAFFHISWISTLTDPFFLRWVYTFTKTSLFPTEQQEQKQTEMLQFTDYAVQKLIAMMNLPIRDQQQQHPTNMAQVCGFNDRGNVSLSYQPIKYSNEPSEPSQSSSSSSSSSSSQQQQHAAEIDKRNREPYQRLTSPHQIMDVEPSIRYQVNPPTSAKYEYQAKAASAERFTRELARQCSTDPNMDVTFLYNTQIIRITTIDDDDDNQKSKNKQRRITQLHTNRGVIPIPDDVQVVVAAGAWTPRILAYMDLYVPVYPLKGYAMSVSASEALASSSSNEQSSVQPSDLPSRIVSDEYMFTTRLGSDEIRITSIGEFSGWDTQPTPHVDVAFRQEAKRQFPQLADLIDRAVTRCGHRPFVNDGILLLGAVDSHPNLYVSCGPGSNGWKLCIGSGEILRRIMAGETPQQIQQELGFDVTPFSPSGRVLYAPWFTKLCRARWSWS